jgi:hypothetical protein
MLFPEEVVSQSVSTVLNFGSNWLLGIGRGLLSQWRRRGCRLTDQLDMDTYE